MIHINSSPEAPPPRIRILDTRSREVETVRIGDRLTFRIEIPEDSKLLLFYSILCSVRVKFVLVLWLRAKLIFVINHFP